MRNRHEKMEIQSVYKINKEIIFKFKNEDENFKLQEK